VCLCVCFFCFALACFPEEVERGVHPRVREFERVGREREGWRVDDELETCKERFHSFTSPPSLPLPALLCALCVRPTSLTLSTQRALTLTFSLALPLTQPPPLPLPVQVSKQWNILAKTPRLWRACFVRRWCTFTAPLPKRTRHDLPIGARYGGRGCAFGSHAVDSDARWIDDEEFLSAPPRAAASGAGASSVGRRQRRQFVPYQDLNVLGRRVLDQRVPTPFPNTSWKILYRYMHGR
jgi:hypothetical protein